MLLFLAAAGLAWLSQTFLFGSIPHVTDASAHLFQAKVLALGRTHAPLPPCHESFFQYYLFMTSDGRWFSRYPPGWALLLAAGLRVQAMNVLGPLLAGAGAAAFFALARRWLPKAAARLAGVLVAVSPMLLLLGGSYMSHTPSLALFAGALWLLLRGGEALFKPKPALREHAGKAGPPDPPCLARPEVAPYPVIDRSSAVRLLLWWVPAGLAAGWGVLVRPQDALLLAPPVLLALALAPLEWRRRFWRGLPWLVLGALGPLGVLAWWNQTQYGSPFAMGYYAWEGVRNLVPLLDSGYGFNDRFTFARALREELLTLWRFNRVAFGWPASFLLAPLALWRWKFRSPVTVCLLALAWNFLFFLGYDYYGIEYEARFYATSVPFLAFLTARGALALDALAGRRVTAALLAVSFLYAAVWYLPQRLLPLYADSYEQATPGLDRLAAALPEPALVLIPQDPDHLFRYTSGFVHNDPGLAGPVIFARDLGAAARDCLAAAFPGRKIYRYEPSSGAGPGRLVPD